MDRLTYFLKPGLAILLIPFFFACNDPNELGLELEADENPFSLSDTTFILPSSSVYIDSLRTDQFNYITAFGKSEDNIYGEVEAISYNHYNITGGQLPENDSIEYVSANIILRINSIRSNNLLGNQPITIYQATERLYRQSVYLASRHTDYDETNPIASHAIGFPSDSIVNIPLSDEYGRSLYNLLELAATNDTYRDSLTRNSFRFDPLVFVPGDENDALYSFNMAPDTVGIYVNMVNSFTGETSSFTFNFRDAHYVKVKRDISSSQKLSNLDADFEENNDPSQTYLDMLAGVYTKIDLQPLLNFMDSQDNLLVNLAEISLGVGNVNEQGFRPEKPRIQFFFVQNQGNSRSINGPGALLSGFFSVARANALLSESSYLTRNELQLFTPAYDTANFNYSGNITLFTQTLADNSESETDFLAEELIVLTPDHLGLGQITFQKSEIQVTLYYTTPK